MIAELGWRSRLVGAIAVLALGLLVRHHLAGMDERLLQPSLRGVEGLLRYTVGDYVGAARAYREHYATGYEPLPGLPSAASTPNRKPGGKPQDVQALLTQGEAALVSNALDAAKETFARILAVETDQYDALLLTAVVETRRGRYGEAITALNRALRNARIETRITTFLMVLETMGELGHLPSGTRPLCLIAHYHRYLRIFDHSQAASAIGYAERAIAASDHPDDCWFSIGMVYLRQGKPHASLEALLHAVRLNPNHAGALNAAAGIYQDRGDLVNERRMRVAAVAAAPDDGFYAEPLFELLLIRTGDYREALAVAETIRALRPGKGAGPARVGYAHVALGDYAAAERNLREALSIEPGMSLAHSALGWTLQQERKPDEAIGEFEAAIALAPWETDPYLRLSRLYYRQRQYREVVGVLTRAISLGNHDPHLYATLCSAYYELSAMAEYEACVPKLLARYTGGIIGLPSIPEAMRTRGLPLPVR